MVLMQKKVFLGKYFFLFFLGIFCPPQAEKFGTFLPDSGGRIVGLFCPPQAENFASFVPAAGGKFWVFSARRGRKILGLFCAPQAENFGTFVFKLRVIV